ncbi:hypothetical protein ACRAWG_00720 [Methylobacterium sp. P31]
MPSKLNAPGYKRRRNPSGTSRGYWCATHEARKAGYPTSTVPIRDSPDDPEGRRRIEAICQRQQADMLLFMANRGRAVVRFDGTIRDLSRRYQTDPASPFQRLKHNSQRADFYVLRLLEKSVGNRQILAIKIGDVQRWYDVAKRPARPGGPERVRKAWGLIKKLRELCAYGVMAELPGCERLYTILRHARFPQSARRRVVMELHQVEAFIPQGDRDGPSVARPRHRPAVRDRHAPEGRAAASGAGD